MMQAVMLSRPNLEKVAQKTDLLLDAKTRREQEAVIDSLARLIKLGRPTGPGTQNTFVVSFENNDPKMAHKVVRTLLDTFMEDSLGLKRYGFRRRAALPAVADQGIRAEADGSRAAAGGLQAAECRR